MRALFKHLILKKISFGNKILNYRYMKKKYAKRDKVNCTKNFNDNQKLRLAEIRELEKKKKKNI